MIKTAKSGGVLVVLIGRYSTHISSKSRYFGVFGVLGCFKKTRKKTVLVKACFNECILFTKSVTSKKDVSVIIVFLGQKSVLSIKITFCRFDRFGGFGGFGHFDENR